MKRKIGFRTVRGRLTFWFLLVALLPLLAVGIIVSQQRIRVIKENAFHKLTAIRNLKVEQVNTWIDERISDLRAISMDNEIRAAGETFNQKTTEKSTVAIRHGKELLNHYVEFYKAYEEVFIINPLTGKVALSSNKARIGFDKLHDPYFTEPMRTKGLYLKEIYYSKTMHSPSMTFSLPIYGKDKNIVGILVSRIDLEQSLYKLLLDRTGMGNTGETLIVNQDVVALNELRWYPDAPLKLNIKARPAKMASQGKSGITETPDYRGEEVLAAYTYIPQTRWGFVAKQDLKEVYASIRAMLLHILVVVLISAAAVYLLALFVARIFARPVLEMTETSRRIQEGDLAARNRIESKDEFGFLAGSFNNLADSMSSQIQVQGAVAHVTDTMVAARELPDFAGPLLRNVVETTGSNLGAFYLLTSDGARFEHCASMGVNPELLASFDASAAEGELGRAAITKEISHIRDIPEDTLFTFRTFTGTVLPKEMITVPLLIDGKVAGLISLAALDAYSEEAMGILNQIWPGINTALSNLLAGEETRELAEELQAKNQELEAQTEELQSMSEELQQRSEELQGQNVELEAQRHQVEEANRLKSEFLSNMSHELRTPLNSVMALSRVLLMQSRQKLSEDEAGYLEIIERNGKRLLSLINDILDLSKIEAGKMDVNPRYFSLAGTIEAIMESLDPVSHDKGLEMIQDIPSDLPRIESDEERVHQILQNLIGNAVKFTDEGSVTVSAHSDEDNFTVQVQDTGIGISENDVPRIFDEFRQVDGSSARKYEGTGLGLAIANKAAGILGGTITVKSIFGQGTAFTFTLPIRWTGTVPEGKPLTVGVSQKITPEQKTILVVDDEPEVITMIAGFVSSQGYNVITASSGREALELAGSQHPFAITLDIIMPDMDGWEVLERLKKDPDTANIPVIVASVTDDRQTGFALGAVGYITKPVNRSALISEISKIGRPGFHNIMVVDDNEIDRQEITRIIQKEGLSAIVAENGPDCMALIKRSLPDVLVLDLMMPGMDGFEVLERLREEPGTVNLPVIVVTAKDLTTQDRRRLSGNVASVLEKSGTTSTRLLREIKRLLLDLENGETRAESGRPEIRERILLVDDNEAGVIQVRTILREEGYGVDVARNGQEALDYVQHTIPNGIILDLMMPEVDGFEVLEQIRGKETTANIPVLILTAKDLTPEDLDKLSANNVQQLVQKGDVEPERLLSKIRTMLGGGTEAETGNWKLETEDPQSVARPGQPATILVVEDSPDNMATLRAVLGNRYNILEATDGKEGLNAVFENRPDLILLDISLPVMDGYQVVREIKGNIEVRNIPVIAMTAHAMKGDREKILAAGCDDYVSKPIDPEVFLEKVGEWLNQ